MSDKTRIEPAPERKDKLDGSIAADLWKPEIQPETRTNSSTDRKKPDTTSDGMLDMPPLFNNDGSYKTSGGDLVERKTPEKPPDAAENKPETKAENVTERKLESNPKSTPEVEKRDWTVMVNLSTRLKVGSVESGADNKLTQLKELADSTKGKSIAIVAQLTEKNPDYKPDSDQSEFLVKRYMIKDGAFNEVEKKNSEGPAKDLEDLISSAAKLAPSEKIALIQQSHGGGAKGVKQDNGMVSLDQFHEALKNGLASSGRNKFDLVDFDSCIMGQDSVVTTMADVAKELVASEETTSSFQKGPNEKSLAADSQNLKAPLEKLVSNTKMNGDDLANTFVECAKNGANDGKREDGSVVRGTDTLAHYDTESAEKLKQAQDQFGTELAAAIKDPKVRDTVAKIIESTPRMVASIKVEKLRDGCENRDLKTFASLIQEAVKDGKIPDSSGKLASAAENVTKAIDTTVENKHAKNGILNYEDMGGLSAFLPSDIFRDSLAQAKLGTPLAFFSSVASGFADAEAKHPDRTKEIQFTTTKQLNQFYESLKGKLGTEDPKQLAPIKAELDALNQATTAKEFREHLNALAKQSKNMLDSPLNTRLAETERAKIREGHEHIQKLQKRASGDSNWISFLEGLGPLTSNDSFTNAFTA